MKNLSTKNLKMLFAPVVLAAAVALPTLAHAGQITTVNQRQAKQGARINAGVRDGGLTPKETAYLRNRAAQIRAQEIKDRQSNGRLSDKEKANLDKQLDDLSRDIDKLRYNKDRVR